MARDRQKPSNQAQIGCQGLKKAQHFFKKKNKQEKDSADFGRAKI